MDEYKEKLKELLMQIQASATARRMIEFIEESNFDITIMTRYAEYATKGKGWVPNCGITHPNYMSSNKLIIQIRCRNIATLANELGNAIVLIYLYENTGSYTALPDDYQEKMSDIMEEKVLNDFSQ